MVVQVWACNNHNHEGPNPRRRYAHSAAPRAKPGIALLSAMQLVPELHGLQLVEQQLRVAF
jgi:hypothetical protein